MSLAGRHVVLGVSGGIASYKACTLARRLTDAGAVVDVILTGAAAEFVRPVTFEALTGRPVTTSLWERDRALAHIHLARSPDLIIVAPATANVLARAAQGMADDLLTAALLAREGHVLAAPAMNDRMFAQRQTAANIRALRRRGWRFIGPGTGPLAEGSSDHPGRMSEPEEIFAEADHMIGVVEGGPLAGRNVLVTAGPTREALDPIRVITNRSSGRMGYALAAAAHARGAQVTLVTGPTALTPPPGPRVVRVETTADLKSSVASLLKRADVLLMAAAPADFRPEKRGSQKREKKDGTLALELKPTDDVLEGTIRQRKRGSVMVGFAYETARGEERAREKLVRKKLDLVALNVEGDLGAGAEVETNRITLVTSEGVERLPLLSKREAAERLLDAVERLL